MITQFNVFLIQYFGNQKASDILAKVDWNTWVFGKGLPPQTNDFMNPDIYNA